jgi:DNA helicase-2/ATP-dependent DNA helicase PcrA
LKSVASGRATLTEFFEHVALVESERFMGERKNKGKGVRLMSLHASKGLEFDTVFLIGLEEGLLPHSRSLEDPPALEEERRLFYVGITRARARLYITWAKRRGMYGRRQYATRSRFISSIDESTSKTDAIIDNWDIDPSVSQWQSMHSLRTQLTNTHKSSSEFDDIDF